MPVNDDWIATATPSDHSLLTLTLYVTDDQRSWHGIVFEGESPRYVDTQARAYLAQCRHAAVMLDEDTTCWELFPRTFTAVLQHGQPRQRAVQVLTH